MGADWLKCRIRPGADLNEVRTLAAFVSEQYPHGHWIVKPSGFSDDDATLARWGKARKQLERLLLFPKGYPGDVDYWSYTSLTDPPGTTLEVALLGRPRVVPGLEDIDICRVYVISCNPILPIESRDEAYRIILPNDLPEYCHRWQQYIQQVHAGQWQHYLHELYVFDRLTDEHQFQEFENLVNFARESLTRTNAWCRKERLAPVRDRILQFNVLERLKIMREGTRQPRFCDAERLQTVTAEQQQKEAQYWEIWTTGVGQIKEWNRLVPQRWKTRFPVKTTFDDFLGQANCSWLKSFFAWCEHLLAEHWGLFLWA
jgi:hypothetical protein